MANSRTAHSHNMAKSIATKTDWMGQAVLGNIGSDDFAQATKAAPTNAAMTCDVRIMLTPGGPVYRPPYVLARQVSSNLALFRALVRRLFQCSRPAAILWRVRAIVVDAVYRHFGCGTRTHVGIKSFKALVPTLAYRNSSSAVAGVSLVLGILATPAHGGPNPIFRAMSKTVNDAGPDAVFFAQASAGNDPSASQVGGSHLFLRPALAAAQPVSETLSPRGGRRDHREAADLTAKHVDLLHTPEGRKHAEVFNG